MTIEKENNKIREELNIDKIESNLVNNVIPNLKNMIKHLEGMLIL